MIYVVRDDEITIILSHFLSVLPSEGELAMQAVYSCWERRISADANTGSGVRSVCNVENSSCHLVRPERSLTTCSLTTEDVMSVYTTREKCL